MPNDEPFIPVFRPPRSRRLMEAGDLTGDPEAEEIEERRSLEWQRHLASKALAEQNPVAVAEHATDPSVRDDPLPHDFMRVIVAKPQVHQEQLDLPLPLPPAEASEGDSTSGSCACS
jgi:hypothetical protein